MKNNDQLPKKHVGQNFAREEVLNPSGFGRYIGDVDEYGDGDGEGAFGSRMEVLGPIQSRFRHRLEEYRTNHSWVIHCSVRMRPGHLFRYTEGIPRD